MTDAQALRSILETTSSLAIVCHDNPDPDCIASALALETIAGTVDVETVDLLYGGGISHQQNRAFVNLLDVDIEPIDATAPTEYDAVAFVDHAVPGQNATVPSDTEVDIVIDHHPIPEGTEVPGQYVDVRVDYAATASILIEYLERFEIDPGPSLASGLLFALHRECLDYVRRPTVHEYEAACAVFQTADLSLLERLYGAAFTPATLDALGEAIRTRQTRGSALVSSVDRTTERDALPQAAEYLINLEGISTVLVFGVIGDSVHLSARSTDPRIDLGQRLADAYGDVGTAGGHHDKAGGRIPLGLFAELDADTAPELDRVLAHRIARRFFESLGLSEAGR